jgi:hypothetical protein
MMLASHSKRVSAHMNGMVKQTSGRGSANRTNTLIKKTQEDASIATQDQMESTTVMNVILKTLDKQSGVVNAKHHSCLTMISELVSKKIAILSTLKTQAIVRDVKMDITWPTILLNASNHALSIIFRMNQKLLVKNTVEISNSSTRTRLVSIASMRFQVATDVAIRQEMEISQLSAQNVTLVSILHLIILSAHLANHSLNFRIKKKKNALSAEIDSHSVEDAQ